MSTVTKAGRELFYRLADACWDDLPFEQWEGVKETLSLVARHARTHHHIQEALCNGPDGAYSTPFARSAEEIDRWQAWIEKRDAQIEARTATLVASLPPTPEGPISVKFGGDPRGATVKLVMPGSLTRLHDDWGREGVCV